MLTLASFPGQRICRARQPVRVAGVFWGDSRGTRPPVLKCGSPAGLAGDPGRRRGGSQQVPVLPTPPLLRRPGGLSTCRSPGSVPPGRVCEQQGAERGGPGPRGFISLSGCCPRVPCGRLAPSGRPRRVFGGRLQSDEPEEGLPRARVHRATVSRDRGRHPAP